MYACSAGRDPTSARGFSAPKASHANMVYMTGSKSCFVSRCMTGEMRPRTCVCGCVPDRTRLSAEKRKIERDGRWRRKKDGRSSRRRSMLRHSQNNALTAGAIFGAPTAFPFVPTRVASVMRALALAPLFRALATTRGVVSLSP